MSIRSARVYLQDCDQIIRLSCDHTRTRTLYLKAEALQYLGRKEEADNILGIANTLKHEERRNIEELTGTRTYNKEKKKIY